MGVSLGQHVQLGAQADSKCVFLLWGRAKNGLIHGNNAVTPQLHARGYRREQSMALHISASLRSSVGLCRGFCVPAVQRVGCWQGVGVLMNRACEWMQGASSAPCIFR